MHTRSGADIVVEGDVVHKVHRDGTDPQLLERLLRIAADAEALLSPLAVVPEPVGRRWRSSWPRVETVVAESDRLPWAEAGALLAALHRETVPRRAPVHGWPARMRRTADRVRGTRGPVRDAAAGLPSAVWRPASPGRPVTLVHGDFHLGQLGRRDVTSRWQLIDVDDVGVGDPAWDLARPAGFWAAGLLPDTDWHEFLDGYRRDGVALPAGDPWAVLEPFARAAVVAAAAAGLEHGDHDETQDALLEACARMV